MNKKIVRSFIILVAVATVGIFSIFALVLFGGEELLSGNEKLKEAVKSVIPEKQLELVKRDVVPAIKQTVRKIGPVGQVAQTPRDSDDFPQQKARLELFILTSEYIVIAGDYSNFFDDVILKIYNTRLKLADQLLQTPKNNWSHRYFYNFATIETMAEYLPQIRKNYQNANYFAISVNGKPRNISQNGYWINAVGCKRVPYASQPGLALTNSADLVPFAYIKLTEPLKNGDEISIKTNDGDQVSTVYNEFRTISRAIKVNQVGYAPEAGRKYAYLGMWLAELGAMPTMEFVGKPFHLRRNDNDELLFSGTLQLRSENQTAPKNGAPIELDGEIVMEMDFSSFKTPGEYYIQIPGVGRSWTFCIGPDAVGRAFYVQMRGLYLQRSGIAKTAEYTGWTMPKDHPFSYKGGFVSNDRHYKGKGGRFTDNSGKIVEVKHFDMIKATATEEKLTDVWGGWWDAGDFDRRPYHFEVVDALLSSYLLFPDNFSDNQLDIPESGNGVPDIVDEAAWGVDVWRRAQNPEGGVGCWLEATSHPHNPDPGLDVQPYYLALPSRGSTIEYSAYAAKLARAYKKCGNMKQANLFFASAEKAWNFAMNPKNTLKTSFNHPKLGKVDYEEPAELRPVDMFKAAFNLYLFDRNENYALELDKIPFKEVIVKAKEEKPAYFLSELVEVEKHPFFIHAGEYRKMIRKRADELLKSQESLSYRNINWPIGDYKFFFLGWGSSMPLAKGSYLIMAWRIDGDAKYRDAALLCVDWMLGTNPMGRSMTSGLGKVSPVRFLSLPMWAWRAELVDPIPGITLYNYNGVNEYAAAHMIFRHGYEERPDHLFKGCSINMLPSSVNDDPNLTKEDCYKILQQTIPLWRRYANLEGYAVAQNEFTVWETMAPAAAAYGALLTPGWKPPPDWKKQQPVKTLEEQPGYIFLP